MSTPTPAPSAGRRGNARIWLVIAAAAVTVLIVAGVIAARDTGPAQANLGTSKAQDVAPSTNSQGQAQGLQGKGQPIAVVGKSPITGAPVDLAAFRGKPVVLQIWASWCHGCNDEAPAVATLSKKRSDVAFVGLNFRDTPSAAKGFYDKYGWTFPSIEDAQGDIAFGLGLQGTPTTIFLDAKGREVGRFVGATDAESFEKAIDQVTASTDA